MPRATRRPPATPPTAQSSRARTSKPRARCEARAGPAKLRRPAGCQTDGWQARRSTGTVSFSERNEIGKEPVGAGHARGELPEPRESGVDVMTLPVFGDQQTALERDLAGVITGQDRDEMFVPPVGKIQPALLDPTVEVGRRA